MIRRLLEWLRRRGKGRDGRDGIGIAVAGGYARGGKGGKGRHGRGGDGGDAVVGGGGIAIGGKGGDAL